MTQKNTRTSLYQTQREREMLEWLCKKNGEGISQLINALIAKEYYRLTISEMAGGG